MYHYSNELAIPLGYHSPSQLPKEFDSHCLKLFEIVDSHVPGYVYLHMKYILSKRKTDGKYVIADRADELNIVLSHEFYVTPIHTFVRQGAEIHGPSACIAGVSQLAHMFRFPSVDTVPCVRCLAWPTQADNWPTRHRNYGWPDSGTVAHVVSNGCDVVGVAHTLCAQDEWMSKHQWRLSFSRAEVVLLNSWTPTHQIIYHMIRIFTKTERLINKANINDKNMFSNYHIKTAMLWACELKPLHWWTDSTNLVSLFAQCLHFLDKWIIKRRGRHYFIKNIHFLDYVDTLSVDTVTAVVKSITEDCLAQWFVDNYMRKCAELCPDNLPVLYSDMVTNEVVHDTAGAILRWKRHIFDKGLIQRALTLLMGPRVCLFRCWKGPTYTVELFSFDTGNVDSIKSAISALEREMRSSSIPVSEFFTLFDNYEFPFKNGIVDCFAIVRSVLERCRLKARLTNEFNGLSPLKQAVVWMKTVADKHPKNHQVIHVDLAKVYLVRATRCTDSDSDSLYNVTNVYLAVLCYITGEYQKATDHCALVTRSQGHPHCSSRVVDGELLPKIDDDIDTVLGLAVFYQYLQTTALKQVQHTQHASVFTTELFAHYFSIRHLLVVNCHLAREKHALRKVKFHLREELKLFHHRFVSAPRLLVTDLMLLKFSNNSSPHQLRTTKPTTYDSDSCNRQQLCLVALLTQMPIQQQLNHCRQLMSREEADGELVAIVRSSDFTALQLYRCKLYERCIQLCQRAVDEMIEGQVPQITRLCFMYQEFAQLMDDEIVSLIGMTVLVDKSGTRSKSKLIEPLNISQLTMSLYLLTQCQIKILSSKWKPDISLSADVLGLVGEAEKLIPSNDALDQLILKLTERLSVMYIGKHLNPNQRRSHGWARVFSIFTEFLWG